MKVDQVENIQKNNSEYDHDLRAQLLKWRKLAGKLSCIQNPDSVGPTGGWCLKPSLEDWGQMGRAAQHHVAPDTGIGKAILKYLNRPDKTTSLIDIGAGVGQYGYWLRENHANIQWTGYDGAENVEDFTHNFVQWIDVTHPTFDTVHFMADWIMCLEVGEHIPSESTHDLIALLDKHNRYGILLSWAIPGQGGHSHINERSNDNVIQLLSEKGYYQDSWCKEFQNYGRQEAIYFWFQNTFMVFKKRPFSHQREIQ